MCIGAAETKAGDASDLVAGVLGPLARILNYFEVLGLEIDIAVRRRVLILAGMTSLRMA